MLLKSHQYCTGGAEITTFLKYWPRKTFSFDICIADYWLSIFNTVKYEGVGRIQYFHFNCKCGNASDSIHHLHSFLWFLASLKENEFPHFNNRFIQPVAFIINVDIRVDNSNALYRLN